jgi:hypothetical protein
MSKVAFKLNGKSVTRDEFIADCKNDNWFNEPPAMASNTYSEHDPLISDGCGVMKSQVKEAREVAKKYGIVGMAVMPNGQIRFTSRRARKEWLRVRGHADMDGGYSD